MQSSTLTALLALGLAVNAHVLPRTNAAVGAEGAASAPAPAAAPVSAAAAATADPTCAQAMILAQGIALNIADQQQELATANQLGAILQAQPVDAQAFATSRQALLQFVNNGIAIRQSNQLITPAGNRATPGVATVANAQLTELQITGSLTATGVDDVAGNLKKVQMLQMNFAGGIQQNMKNMADVSCLLCSATSQVYHLLPPHLSTHPLYQYKKLIHADNKHTGHGRMWCRRCRRSSRCASRRARRHGRLSEQQHRRRGRQGRGRGVCLRKHHRRSGEEVARDLQGLRSFTTKIIKKEKK